MRSGRYGESGTEKMDIEVKHSIFLLRQSFYVF